MDGAADASPPDTPTSILICREDGNDVFGDAIEGAGFLAADKARLLLLDQDEEYVALLLSKEGADSDDGDCFEEEMEGWMKAARSGCVGWIIKTTATFRFSGKTAFVAVAYLDRFLARRRVVKEREWALHLLSVACLSLAMKAEEHHRAPRLSEFRLDEHEFDSTSIMRMELHVMATLRWRMITITPYPYIISFAARFRQDERRAIIPRALEGIFAAIRVMSSVEFQPSTIALASILVARNRPTPAADLEELKAILCSSWPQLDAGQVYACYSMMIQEDKSPMHSTEVASSVVSVAAHDGSPGTSVGANNAAGTGSLATPPDNKRRKLGSPQHQ